MAVPDEQFKTIVEQIEQTVKDTIQETLTQVLPQIIGIEPFDPLIFRHELLRDMWKTNVKYLWWEFWYQISFFWYPHGSYKWQKRAQYYKALFDHVKRERAKVDADFKRQIRERARFICYLCGHFKCWIGDKPMVVEHKLPVIRWGITNLLNCDLACWHCNQEKGTRTETEYRAWKKKRSFFRFL